jgi:transcriptional regulator with XRE-family HTH domain
MDTVQIGKFLAALRKERGMTQEQLGEQLGVTNKTISRWENGNYLPPVEMLQLLSDLYGITINEILSGQRLTGQAYQEKAEENLRTALEAGPFTLEEKVAYYKNKWRKDHFAACLLFRIIIWGILAVGIFTNNLYWAIAYGIVSLVYYCVERNQMMIYVEDRAYDGSGRR